MAIDVFLISPDGLTTITLKASKVAQRIQRVLDITPLPNTDSSQGSGAGRSVDVDLNQYAKQFTITASVTTGSALDKSQYEALENAAQTWATQTSNRGMTLFRYSTKDDDTNKDYRVRWLSLDLMEDVEAAPQVYSASIVLQEVHALGGFYSISGTAGV